MSTGELNLLLDGFSNTDSFMAGSIVGGVLAAVIILCLIFGIMIIVAGWKIFEKAGEKGWKILIPIYDCYILFKILGLKKWFWPMFIASVLSSVLMINFRIEPITVGNETQYIYYGLDRPDTIIGMILASLTSLAAAIMVTIQGAKAFKKSVGFAVCMFFFPNICWLILGFGKSKYHKRAVIPAAEEKEEKEDEEE